MGSMFGGGGGSSSATVAAEKVVTPATAKAAESTSETADAKAKRTGIVGSYNRYSSVDDSKSGGTSSTLG